MLLVPLDASATSFEQLYSASFVLTWCMFLLASINLNVKVSLQDKRIIYSCRMGMSIMINAESQPTRSYRPLPFRSASTTSRGARPSRHGKNRLTPLFGYDP